MVAFEDLRCLILRERLQGFLEAPQFTYCTCALVLRFGPNSYNLFAKLSIRFLVKFCL